MRILIAPDSFKESMTASRAAEAIARGVRKSLGDGVEIDLCPMADGGEGTIEALVMATNGTVRSADVVGPLGSTVHAQWGMLGDGGTAVIELAQAAGLALVPENQRDPTRTTTYGVGQLIAEALGAAAKKIIVGIGGSATHDGGTGMAQALGVQFFAHDRDEITTPLTGGLLPRVGRIDLRERDSRLLKTPILAACDVTNPLTGPRGAAAIYGPQKGASPETVCLLDEALDHLASLLPEVDATRSGMGAAGGMGFGLVAFCNAELVRGIDLVLDATRFGHRARVADLVITGEGRLDGQSVQGKTCIGVAQAAARSGSKTIALVGSIGPDAEVCLDHGLMAYDALSRFAPGLPTPDLIRRGPFLLENLCQSVIEAHVGRRET